MMGHEAMDTYGKVLRTIKFKDGLPKNSIREKLYYEAAIIQDNDVVCMYIRVTDLRYMDSINQSKKEHETYGTHFNIEWLDDEKQQDWLAYVIGNAMAESIYNSNERTVNEIKKRMNSLMSSMGINLQFKD